MPDRVPKRRNGQNSRLNKTLEIYGEMPGRIHLVLIREVVGF